MAWVGGLFVLFTISVNIGIRSAVEPTTPSMSSPVSMSNLSHGSSKKPQNQPFQMPKTTSIAVTTPSIFTKIATLKNSSAKPKHSMRESVVILTPDSQREAEEIYQKEIDKALKQYDSYGVSTRQTCAAWEKRGCQCSGTVEQLTLSCRSIGLNETPTELPKSLIKL